MATVHPSRLGLVPSDNQLSRDRPPHQNRDSRDDRRERDRGSDRYRQSRDDDRNERPRSRSRSPGRGREARARRSSPEYSAYRRPKSPSPARDGNGQEQPSRPHRGYGNRYGGGGADYLESRRLQREAATANVWPPSPKAPRSSSSDSDHKRSKRSKRRRRSPSTDSSELSSEEERRRKEKRKRRSRKDRSRHHKSSQKSRRHDDSEDDERDRRRDRRRRSSTRSPQRQRTESKSVEQTPPRSPEEPDDDEWVEKPSTGVLMGPPPVPTASSSTATATAAVSKVSTQPVDDDSDFEVGPQPALVVETRSNKRIDERQYGGALLRGEGSAMAAFLQEDTNVRIPRRGEIGLTSDEIANFESVGYVMSGSRHKRMNAVRIRKENQVISAEEKRGILKLQKEERERREGILREEFQELVSEKLKATESGRGPSKA